MPEEKPEDIVGHKSFLDGSHEPLTRAESEAIWAEVQYQEQVRLHTMPEATDALKVISSAHQRLRELGWRDGSHCPKDGTPFAAIEYGCTAILTGFMTAEWPYGFAYIEDYGRHPHSFLWKPISELTEAEEASRQQSAEDTKVFMDRLMRM